jgi:hypothetical protein
MLVEHITPTDRPIGDRGNTVGASEIGHCARQVWYRKHDQPPEREDGWGFRERGHVVEAWLMERLRAADVPVQNVQRQVSRGFLSCTVDWTLNSEPGDCKSFDPRKTRIPDPKHIIQSQVQSGLWGAPRGWLLYINASDFQDIREFEVPAIDIASLEARAREIMTGPLPPPEGRIAGGDECEHCLFQTACLGAPIEGKGKLSDESEAAVKLAADEARAQESKAETHRLRAAAARELVRDILRAADVKRAKGLARISRRQNTTLDYEAMERDGIDLARYRKPGRVSETVTLEQ